MQKLFIVGNLTGDPQTRTTNSGKEVCSFTVAVNRRQKKTDGTAEADFFRVSAWEGMAKVCQQYLAKGRKVAVTGTVSVSTYQAQDGTTRASMDVFAQDVEFLTPRGEGQSQSAPAAPAPVAGVPAMAAVDMPDDQLPF